jgi:hypothetical protein
MDVDPRSDAPISTSNEIVKGFRNNDTQAVVKLGDQQQGIGIDGKRPGFVPGQREEAEASLRSDDQ